jgi:hypothetical protein
MNHLAPSMCEHDQDKENLEPDRWHDEEIDRHLLVKAQFT